MSSAPQTGKVVLITGSGRPRIGQFLAADLAKRGYRIALHYHRSEEPALWFRDQLRAAGTDCEAFQADLGNEADIHRLFAELQRHYGRLDVLIATAAVWQRQKLEEVTAVDLLQNFSVNVLGSFLCARSAGLQMAEQPAGGAIIFFGDAAIHQPYLHHAPYFAAKGSLPTLTRTLAVELAARNPKVRVNCIEPGPVMLPPHATTEERQQLQESTLVQQADCPEMVSLTVQFLIENQFLTGACIPVDGGRNLVAGLHWNRNSGE